MRIGIDLHFLRDATWTGLEYYVRHLFEGLSRLNQVHHIVPFLYGCPELDLRETRGRLKDAFPAMKVQYYWENVSPRLLSTRLGIELSKAPWLVQQIDRKLLLPLYRRVLRVERKSRDKPRVTHWPWRTESPSGKVDLFHHMVVPVFPFHDKANVLTVPDLTTLRVPETHVRETIAWFQECLASIPNVDALITFSEHTKSDIVELLGVDEERVYVTPLAPHEQYRPTEDRERLQSVLAKYGLLEYPYVISVATLEPRKNQGRLLEAFRSLKRAGRLPDHRLLLVGAEGWNCQSVLRSVNDPEMQRYVKWIGYAPFEDLPALLSGADLFVYAPLYEGFGLPPLEAMACGTPAVVSNNTSLPEVTGGAGILVDPLRVDEIAAALHRVLSDGELRAVLSRKGLARAHAFTWENTAKRTLAAYEGTWRRVRQERTGGRSCRKAPSNESRSSKLLDVLREYLLSGSAPKVDWPL